MLMRPALPHIQTRIVPAVESAAGALRDRGVTSGAIAFEPTTRLFIVDGVREASASAYRVVSGDALVKAVRLIKSPAELALMQIANNVTLAALRYVHGNVRAGMRPDEIATLMGIAEGTSKAHLHTARAKLKEVLR